MSFDTTSEPVTHGELAIAFRELRRFVASRSDLVDLAAALDEHLPTAMKRALPATPKAVPIGWRFVVVRDEITGLIEEIIATPMEIPQ